MSRIITFASTSRLLVFAPHPDDETLATGELIQLALNAGAEVRVVFATDGDNNPWPQRWSEKRWRIGADERARWGARRRSEAAAALTKLGVAQGSSRFLGWPDLGLTRLLMRDDTAIDTLASEIAAFKPTHVAMPSMRDRHPDHGALHVMSELAIAKTGVACVCLSYVVHGRSAARDAWLLPRDAQRHDRKRAALDEHASQITLSRRRLMRWASVPESFEASDPREGAMSAEITIPLEPSQRFWRRHDLLLVLADRTRIERVRLRLPRIVRRSTLRLFEENLPMGRVTIELSGGSLHLKLDGSAAATNLCGYVKLERGEPRLVIFDNDTWHRFEDFAAAHESAASNVETVAVAQRASL